MEDSSISTIIGAVIGGVMALAGSYWGAERGARKNYELTQREKELTARQRLVNQLSFTFNYINSVNNQTGLELSLLKPEFLIFDRNWPEQLSQIRGLTGEEIKDILLWFHSLERFSGMSKESSKVSVGEVIRYLEGLGLIERIEKICFERL